MNIDFNMDVPISSFLEDLRDYAEDIDVDEHVEMWLPERSKKGCPGSIKALVDDAESIKGMINELYKFLYRQKEPIKVNITLEKTIRISQDFEIAGEQLELLKEGINPFQKELESKTESGYVEYDYAVCDDDGNTIIDWE